MAKLVYIETTVFSALFTPRVDTASAYRREMTRRWWDKQREHYDLWTSRAAMEELQAGMYEGQEQAIALAASLQRFDVSVEAVGIAEIYVKNHLMPGGKSADGLHLAIASVNETDYLLTWNIRHLANPNKVEHMTVVNRRLGLLTPVITSPDALWLEETP